MDLGFEPSHIAVIQTGFMGDVVFASPLVKALRTAWPSARVTFVCRPEAAALARCIPGVSDAMGYDGHAKGGGAAGLLRTARALRGVELALVLKAALRNAALAYLSRARVRVGPADRLARALFTVAVPTRAREPFVERTLDLARALGVEAPTELKLEAPPAALEAADRLLGARPSVGLVIGAEWETNRWPAESFAALADRLADDGWRPVLLGAPSERDRAAEIKARLARAEALDLVGRPLLDTAAIIARLQAVVGGDTGLLHVGRAVGTPSLLLFGATDPGAHTLEPHAQALRLGLPCQPCHPQGQLACPLGHHDCMKTLDIERVLGALRALLRRPP